MCPPQRSPCIPIDSSTRTRPFAARRASSTKRRATSRSFARTDTSIRRSSPRIAPFPSRRRCSSRRITTSSGCCTRRASRWSRWACRRGIRRPPIERDPRKVWQLFAANYHLFRGTPSRAWLDYELHELFGVREQARRAIGRPHLRPDRRAAAVARVPAARALRAASTSRCWRRPTPRPTRSAHHQAIRASGWNGPRRADLPARRAVPHRAPRLAGRARGARAGRAGARSRYYAEFREALVARRAALPRARRHRHRPRRGGAVHRAARAGRRRGAVREGARAARRSRRTSAASRRTC